MTLQRDLQRLRSRLAASAQAVYDKWSDDDEVGDGGICDLIADAMTIVISESLPDVSIRAGGHDGDDHAWLIVQRAVTGEAIGVDIPASVYERGAGYQWTRLPDVTIEAGDVAIFRAVYENEDEE